MANMGSGRGATKATKARGHRHVTPELLFSMTKERAFEIYSQRGHNPGDEMSDWLEAERQIKRDLKLK